MKILRTKTYNDMVDKVNYLDSKVVDLTLDNADKDAQMQLYNTQVNYLMGKVEDLTKKLDKKTKELKDIKNACKRYGVSLKKLTSKAPLDE